MDGVIRSRDFNLEELNNNQLEAIIDARAEFGRTMSEITDRTNLDRYFRHLRDEDTVAAVKALYVFRETGLEAALVGDAAEHDLYDSVNFVTSADVDGPKKFMTAINHLIDDGAEIRLKKIEPGKGLVNLELKGTLLRIAYSSHGVYNPSTYRIYLR